MSDTFIIEDFPMSQVEFEKRFNTEQACIDWLAKTKWPGGFYCGNCGHKAYWISAKHLYIRTRCESPHSLTAGTVMHGTKKPLLSGSKPCGGSQPAKPAFNSYPPTLPLAAL